MQALAISRVCPNILIAYSPKKKKGISLRCSVSTTIPIQMWDPSISSMYLGKIAVRQKRKWTVHWPHLRFVWNVHLRVQWYMYTMQMYANSQIQMMVFIKNQQSSYHRRKFWIMLWHIPKQKTVPSRARSLLFFSIGILGGVGMRGVPSSSHWMNSTATTHTREEAIVK